MNIAFALGVLGQSLMITSFVFVMMLVIEYVNVMTAGRGERLLVRHGAAQPWLGALLGTPPGCLGSFGAVSLYIHRVLTVGGLTATMIATSGDEAFVMLALFPGRALVLFGVLFVVGGFTGWLVDRVWKEHWTRADPHAPAYAAVHAGDESCRLLRPRELLAAWRRCSLPRGALCGALALFVAATLSGLLAGDEEHWVRITLAAVGAVGLWIVATSPDHFLREHLWKHIVKVHIGRMFLWTLGALVVTHLLLTRVDINALVGDRTLPLLLVACLVGIIPESGPHLVFVTLYARGAIPFSVLLASSIVQDGHGMIPLLSHSRRAFVGIKAVNFAVGLLVGLLAHALGW